MRDIVKQKLGDIMFLPINRQEMNYLDWHYVDFLIITGDAIVDHYSFGSSIIARWMEHLGYRVGIISQPDWNDPNSVKIMGKPRLGVLVGSGNMDSMINHYTAVKKPRRQDNYTAGGKTGKRPDYAAAVYAKMAKDAFPETPVIMGGIEASLRRFAHYDYWSNTVKSSWLMEGNADLLVYGMSELALKEIAGILAKGGNVGDCRRVAGTAYRTDNPPAKKTIELPSLRQVTKNKQAFAKAFRLIDIEQNHYDGKILVQRHDDEYLVVNPPMRPLTTPEMDEVYELPFENKWHPSYDELGGVPAFQEVEFSLLSHRGCFSGCSFCAINMHQGGVIQNRSAESIVREAKRLVEKEDFKGYIHDIGGPTANYRGQGCDKAKKRGLCRHQDCMMPKPCKNLKPNMEEYIDLLQTVEALPKVKKVFIRSGIRYDYIMHDRRNDFLKQLVQHNVSGLLKVAPEHSQDRVLEAMCKPSYEIYKNFNKKFERMNEQVGKKQFLLPYFIAAHPGCTLEDAVSLALVMKRGGHQPEQVQLFIPTPGTRSTCMYYTGINPKIMEPVYVALGTKERDMQRALLQFNQPKNFQLVREALIKVGREDLIGLGKEYLVPPAKDDKGNFIVPKKKAVEPKNEGRKYNFEVNAKGKVVSRDRSLRGKNISNIKLTPEMEAEIRAAKKAAAKGKNQNANNNSNGGEHTNRSNNSNPNNSNKNNSNKNNFNGKNSNNKNQNSKNQSTRGEQTNDSRNWRGSNRKTSSGKAAPKTTGRK